MKCDSIEVLNSAILESKHSKNRNKSIGIFGGSISMLLEIDYDISLWEYYLSTTVKKYGKYGRGFATTSGDNIMEQVDKAPIHDIYILWCSTNDYANSVPVGDIDDYTIKDGYDRTRLNTQCGAMNYCIKTLKEKNPEAQIYIFGSLKHFGDIGGYIKDANMPNNTGKNFYSYVVKQKEVAEANNIPFLNQFDLPCININTKDRFYKPDNYHLTVDGYYNIGIYHLYFLATEKEY
ncbi:MAG: SGNH/GDSL hydrolase family protein [Bacteroidaceae bacterium]|nr:SGNH/GDSL hydrolase family protein [Bacteroidaceae bacterium]